MELPRHDARQVGDKGTPATEEYRYRRVLDQRVKQAETDLALKAPIASPALTGNPTAPTASPGDNDTSIATTAFVTAAVAAAPQVVLQVLQNIYTANTNLTDQIPSDDSIPVKASEGTEVLTQAITPASASNKILVEAHVFGGASGNNTDIVMAIFRGSTCIQVVQSRAPTANFPVTISASFLDSPATASAVTYSVNVGPVGAVTIRLNGNTLTRLFGGASSCTLTLSEIKG